MINEFRICPKRQQIITKPKEALQGGIHTQTQSVSKSRSFTLPYQKWQLKLKPILTNLKEVMFSNILKADIQRLLSLKHLRRKNIFTF